MCSTAVFFYDAESMRREIGPHGEIELSEIDEAVTGEDTCPFIKLVAAPLLEVRAASRATT